MLLRAEKLNKTFKEKNLKAVSEVSFSLEEGKTLGVVGESGSGKSTLAKLVLGLVALDSGEVFFEEKSLKGTSKEAWKDYRKKVQVVFQEPFASLDPRMKIENILEEPFLIHGLHSAHERQRKINEALNAVELAPHFRKRYPRELSGGECQRVAIARALCLEPRLIVCDEVVSSLDMIVQVQVLNLLLRLQKEKKVAYLFISHDLRVVRHMSDDVLVLKDGSVCEQGSREAVFHSPKHPYTQKLLQSSLF